MSSSLGSSSKAGVSRRVFIGSALATGVGMTAAAAYAFRRKLQQRLARLTLRKDFSATPALLPHDSKTERRTLHVSRGLGAAANIEAVVSSLGGMHKIVGKDDVVLIKVSAQWWNQGMTNVAAVKRTIELILAVPGFTGEVIVFENTHFLKDGSPLTRAFTRPSDRNVDVPGWRSMGDLIPHFKALAASVSFVGLIDAIPSSLGGDGWHDETHEHGIYGGDGRGPIAEGEERDGFRWDFAQSFRVRRSLVDHAQTPLTWPVFSSPRTGLVIDFKEGLFRREGGRRVRVDRKLTWINMPTVNEHSSTGLTCCCKSAMGVVDMSAGHPGTDPRTAEYQSVHYFGSPNASWRMAGPLAHFARTVRTPDLYLAVAEWVAAVPRGAWDPEKEERLEASAAHHVGAVVAGTDPVAIDAWCAKNLLYPLGGANQHKHDTDNPDSLLSRFLREYRRVYGSGTLDHRLIDVA